MALSAIESCSLSGLSLKRTPRGEGQVRLTQTIFTNPLFNAQVDAPLLPKHFLNGSSFQNLEMLALPLHDDALNLIGLMRVFTGTRFSEEMQTVYARAASAIGPFCARMQSLRGNFSALQRDLEQKNEQLMLHALENCVHGCLFDVLDGLQEGTKTEFLTRL